MDAPTEPAVPARPAPSDAGAAGALAAPADSQETVRRPSTAEPDSTQPTVLHAAPADETVRSRPAETVLRTGDATQVITELPAPVGTPPGAVRTIGPYDVLKVLGRGGMGIVYLAQQRGLDRRVALKVMTVRDEADEEPVQRFMREAQSAAKLHHPGIVPIYDVGQDGPLHYYSMEFVEGRTLDQHAPGGTLTPRAALELAGEVARALAYAHGQGVIHRDIKPQNVIVDAAGRAHLTDFGLAKDLGKDAGLTQTGAVMGTPAYMPPEQAMGRPAEIDARADVYSLGASLYQLLTGKPPFTGETPIQVIQALLHQPPRPVRQLVPKINGDIETICMKCLEKAPDRRYGSAAALAEDIDAFLQGLPIRARPPSLPERATRWLRRHRPAVAWAAVGLLTMAAAAAWEHYRRLDWIAREQAEHASFGASREDLRAAGEILATAAAEPADRFPAAAKAARKRLDAAVARSPGMRDVQLARSRAARLQDNLAIAADDLLLLTNRDPRDGEACYRLLTLADELRRDQRGDELKWIQTESATRGAWLEGAASPWGRRARVLRRTAEGDRKAAFAELELLRGEVGESADQDADLLRLQICVHSLDVWDLDSSLPEVEALLRAAPRDPSSYRLAARIYRDLRQHARAADLLSECFVLQAAPPYCDFINLGSIWFDTYRAEARTQLGALLEDFAKNHPGSVVPWIYLAKFHRHGQEWAKEAEALARAAALEPDNHSVVAELYRNLHRSQGAEAAAAFLDDHLAKHPPATRVRARDGTAVEPLLTILVELDEWARAEAILAPLRKEFPEDAQLLVQDAEFCFHARRNEEALRLYDAAIAREPNDAKFLHRRARIERRLGRLDDALRDLQRVVQLDPTGRQAREQFGGLLALRGRFPEAAQQFAELLYVTPLSEIEDALHRWARGDVGKDSNPGGSPDRFDPGEDPEKAIQGSVLKHVISGIAGILLKRGRDAMKDGRNAQAEHCFTIAQLGMPDRPEPYLWMARLDARREQWLHAVLCLEQAAALKYEKFGSLPADADLKSLLRFPRVRRLVDAAEKK